MITGIGDPEGGKKTQCSKNVQCFGFTQLIVEKLEDGRSTDGGSLVVTLERNDRLLRWEHYLFCYNCSS